MICANFLKSKNSKIQLSLKPFKTLMTRTSRDVTSVKLAYASYESTSGLNEDDPPPLIILHGLFGSKANWNSLCKAYHKRTMPQRKVIAVDARNHGDSPHTRMHTYQHMVEDLRELYHQLRIDKAALLGHSMGGRAVMLLALKYPQYVERLVVADISPISTSRNLRAVSSLFTAMQKINIPKNIPLASARMNADLQLARTIYDRGIRSFILTNLVQKGDGSYTWRINIPALMTNFNAILNFPHTKGLKFEGPVLFVGGGASDFIQKSDHPQILKLFPNAQFVYIEGAGHWLHNEKPTEFLQVTSEFLNKQITFT